MEFNISAALWCGIPTHNITCVLVTSDGKSVFTGSATGEICIWDLHFNTKQVEPKILCVSDSNDPVVEMCNGTYKAATDIPVVVSLSSQSVLRIWNAIDGAFIGECSELYGLLPLAVSMTMLQDKDTLVVCGAGQRAYFVSIGSKQVIAAVRSHRDWITHISTRSLEGETTEEDLARRHHSLLIGDTRTADAYDRDYVTEAVADALGEMPEFVTGSLDGTVAVWGARAFRDRSVAWEITPLLRLHLTQLVGRVEGAHKCLVCADISNDGGMLAVVTVKKWFLVSLAARAHPTVAAVRIPRSSDLLQESEWAGGYFVSNTLFFCWSQLGVGFLYRIEMQAPQRQPQASSPPSPDANTSPNAPLHPSSSSSSPPPPPPPPAAAVPPSKEADENIEIELEHSRRVTPAPSHDHTSDGGSGAEVVWGGNEDKGSIFDDMCYTVRLLYCLDPPVFPVDPAEKGLKTSGWRGSYSKGIFSVANGNNIASWVFPKITEAPILFGGKGIVISDSALLATGHASDGRGPSAEGALPQPAGSVAVSMQQKQQHGLLSSSTSLVISEGDHNALEDDFSTMAQRSYEDQIAMYSSSIDSLRKAKIIRPSATGSFRAGFRGLRNHHHHPSNNSKSSSSSSNSGNDKCEVTCSCLLEDIMMLACGYSNGEVSTTIFQAESVFKCFQAHTKRVTNILAPDPSISKDCRYLITAGDDFCIKVWNVFTQELLKSFNMHTGVITKLVPLTPPSLIQGAIDITSPLRHSFMSIGADHCIGIFSLDTKTCQHWFTGHTADIVEVRWKVEQGYILVACADTSVTVWELSSCKFIERLSGPRARTILDNYCMILYSNKRAFDPATPAEPLGITTGTVALGDPVMAVPLQVISLNIKELLQRLQENNAASRRIKEVQYYDTKLQTMRRTQQEFRYPPFTVFGLLYPWGVSTEMDGLVRRKLQLRQAQQPVATLGYYGDGRNMTFLLPTPESQRGGYYARSEMYTGIGFLSLMGMLICMRDSGVCVPETETLMRFLCNSMASALPGFVNPSLPFLSLFWSEQTLEKTPSRVVARSARMLVSSIVSRLPKESIIRYANENMAKLTAEPAGAADPMIPLVSLAIIVLDRIEVFDRDTVAYVANEFVRILFSEPSKDTVTAIEFINRGFEIWKSHMDNPTLILNRLFLISVMAGKYKTQAMYAKKAMFSIAARFPDMFLDMIISEIAPDSKNQITAMAALSIIAKEWDPVYVPFISRIVKIFLIALDPVSPSTRSNLTTAVSRTIEYLTGAYPMVSFERESQRIAVCEFSSLSIFDTKTGKLIFKALLEAGTLATALSPTGKSVAVLTSEGYIYVWQLTNNKSASATAKKADRIFTVPCPDTVSLASPSKDIRLEWTIGMLCLRLPKIEKLIKYPMDKSL